MYEIRDKTKPIEHLIFFSQLPAVKKDTIFGAAQTNFRPSYFVTALAIFNLAKDL